MTTGLLTPTHIAILLAIVLILLGPKRLPPAGRALGRSMREFKDGISSHDVAATDAQIVAPAADTAARDAGAVARDAKQS